MAAIFEMLGASTPVQQERLHNFRGKHGPKRESHYP